VGVIENFTPLRGDRGRLRPARQTIRRVGRAVVTSVEATRLRGDVVRCPCCGGAFRAFADHNGKEGERCPRCWSISRHRFLYLYLREEGLIDGGLHVLHIAPEEGIYRHFKGSTGYVTGDLIPSVRVRQTMTVEQLPFADECFDLLLCSHVLEHVPDDGLALREFRRVLRPGGRALLQHPILLTRERTDEDPTVTDPAERLRRFGQHDHVRLYGRDFPARVREAGFDVSVVRLEDRLTTSARETYAVSDHPEMSGALLYVASA
jgi:SAM-dependent methyltransferase